MVYNQKYTIKVLICLHDEKSKVYQNYTTKINWINYFIVQVTPSSLKSTINKVIFGELTSVAQLLVALFWHPRRNIPLFLDIITKKQSRVNLWMIYVSHDSCIRDLILYFKNQTQPLTDFWAS